MECANDTWREGATLFTLWALFASVLIGAGVYRFTGGENGRR